MQTLPNIVWMVSDHQPFGNRGPEALSFAVQSRLAQEGTRFARAYTVLPVCSPARASMLTGVYPHRHGLTENDGRFGGRAGLDPGDWLVNRSLSDAGYRCAWFGKWHLDQRRPAQAYGFEGYSLPGYGYPYGSSAYRDYLSRLGLAAPVATIDMPGESGRPAGTRIRLAEMDDWFDYEAGVARLDGPVEAHEAYFIARLASDWIHETGDEPFFLRVDPWGPHPPYMLSSAFFGQFDASDGHAALSPNALAAIDHRPDHHRDYRDYWYNTLQLDGTGWQRMGAAALAHAALVETALTHVLDAIDDKGIADRTLVIFTADHGDAVASNGGVANKGSLMVEESMRVPLLIRGPGFEPGAVCDTLVTNMDVAPTILELCGLICERDLDGESLVGVARGERTFARRGLMAEHYGLHERIVQRAYYDDHWKLVVQQDGFQELYDLDSDPYELNNLADTRSCEPILRKLHAGLVAAAVASHDGEISLFDGLEAEGPS